MYLFTFFTILISQIITGNPFSEIYNSAKLKTIISITYIIMVCVSNILKVYFTNDISLNVTTIMDFIQDTTTYHINIYRMFSSRDKHVPHPKCFPGFAKFFFFFQ